MARQPLSVTEARQKLNALVERVARGGAPIAIGRYKRKRAVLVGAEEFAKLTKKRNPIRSLEGSLTLNCTPEELIAERRKIGREMRARIDVFPRLPR
jgi:prevent-host-death family protein